MAARVLSTDQAKSAITQVQAIINGGLTEQISKLDAQGKVLSNPDIWDGPLAQQFRDSTWPETKSALDKEHTELDQLRKQLQNTATKIMTDAAGSWRTPLQRGGLERAEPPRGRLEPPPPGRVCARCREQR